MYECMYVCMCVCSLALFTFPPPVFTSFNSYVLVSYLYMSRVCVCVYSCATALQCIVSNVSSPSSSNHADSNGLIYINIY